MANETDPQTPPTDAGNQAAGSATGGATEAANTSTDQSVRPAPRLLELLVCPLTKSTLELSRDHTELISRRARVAYPIRDGIPLLTSETARDLTDEELKTL